MPHAHEAHDPSEALAAVRPRGRERPIWRVAAASAALTLVIGVGLGTWLGRTDVLPGDFIANADSRPRPAVGEARLIIDRSFDGFSARIQARDRSRPAARPAARPAVTSQPPREAPPRPQATDDRGVPEES
jgi:hypothetical protein